MRAPSQLRARSQPRMVCHTTSSSLPKKKAPTDHLRRLERVHRRLLGTRQGFPLWYISGMLAEAIRASLVVTEAGDLALEKCGHQPFLRPVHLACVATGHSAPRPPPRSSGRQSSPTPRGTNALTPRTITTLHRLCLLAYQRPRPRAGVGARLLYFQLFRNARKVWR
jgi:hypothetical protein